MPLPFGLAAIDRVIAGVPDPRLCAHQPGMQGYPDGYSTFELTIDSTGRVRDISVAKSEGLTPAIEACLIRGMRPWVFPARQDSSDVSLFLRVDLYLRDWGNAQGEAADVYAVSSADDPGPQVGRASPPLREWTRQPGSLACQTPATRRGDSRGMEFGKATSEKKEAVRVVIKRHREEVRACYEASLLTNPSLKGTIYARFTLDPTGHVAHSCITESTVPDPAIGACILEAILKWSFASVHSAGWTTIEYPWILGRFGP